MKRRFRKMHGLGNDFVIFDAREESLEMDGARARALADRRTGIGCDQLIVIEPSKAADAKMRIWNRDGGEVEACGNASRCVAWLLGGDSVIETAGGILHASAQGEGASVALGPPRFAWEEVPLAYAVDTDRVPAGWEGLEDGAALRVGNPHIVFFVEDPGMVPLDRLGPLVENDPLFPERVNVSVASIEDGAIRLRVWERGAGLTMACGTAACATAVTAIRRKLVQSPVTVRLPGGELTVTWAPGETIVMTGSATAVFEGEVEL